MSHHMTVIHFDLKKNCSSFQYPKHLPKFCQNLDAIQYSGDPDKFIIKQHDKAEKLTALSNCECWRFVHSFLSYPSPIVLTAIFQANLVCLIFLFHLLPARSSPQEKSKLFHILFWLRLTRFSSDEPSVLVLSTSIVIQRFTQRAQSASPRS